MSVEDRLHEMGLSLSEPNAPVANFVPAVRAGNLLFVAGHLGFMPDGSILHPGKVGRDVTEEQAYESARQAMLNCLAAIKAEVGSLDNVKRVVKLLVMVNADPEVRAPLRRWQRRLRPAGRALWRPGPPRPLRRRHGWPPPPRPRGGGNGGGGGIGGELASNILEKTLQAQTVSVSRTGFERPRIPLESNKRCPPIGHA